MHAGKVELVGMFFLTIDGGKVNKSKFLSSVDSNGKVIIQLLIL